MQKLSSRRPRATRNPNKRFVRIVSGDWGEPQVTSYVIFFEYQRVADPPQTSFGGRYAVKQREGILRYSWH